MQSVSSRIWTRITVSISHNDNYYTTGNQKYMTSQIQENVVSYVN